MQIMQLVRYQTKDAACQEGKKRQIASASGRCPLGPEGEGGTFDGPALPPLDSLPTLDDQGMPLDPKEEVALVGWLKKRVRVH